MTIALACGAGIGFGLLLVIRGLFPPRVPLAVAFDRLHGTNHRGVGPHGVGHGRGHLGDFSPQAPAVGFAACIGHPLARHLVTLPLLSRRVRSDLAVLGRSPEQHLAERITLALFGFLIVPAFAGVLLLGGADLGWTLPLWTAIVFAAGGFFAPDLGVHSEAATRRADFRHALGSFLDLVVISLAGGAGVEGALSEAAAVGHGWAFARLRRALDESRLTRTAPWGPLGRLGEALGVAELSELAATVSLAGAEGAKVRASLGAKAASIRAHALADAQAKAEAMSERMSLPVVVLFAGFLLFVGYPALANVLKGL